MREGPAREALKRIRSKALTFKDGQLDANEVARLCEEGELEEVTEDEDATAKPLSTWNEWFITAKDDRVVMQHRPGFILQPEEAIRLAAWLVMGAELAGKNDALEVTIATFYAVRST